MKNLGPCDVRSCGLAATWETEDFYKFCDDHTTSWLIDNNPVDDGLDDGDGLNEEDFAA